MNMTIETKPLHVKLMLLLPLLLLAACGRSGDGKSAHGPGGGMPPAAVSVITVEPKTLPAQFEYTGQTLGSREVEVRARVTGIVQTRNFVEGGHVSKGQSLFTIDQAPFNVAVARADADVASAEAKAAQAKKNTSRLKPLFAEKAVSQKDFDDAASAESIAEAELKGARARLAEAQLNLLYTKVESPLSGITGRAQRSEGTLVSGPDVLLTTVTQIDPMWVSFGVPDNDQLKLNSEAAAGRLVLPKGGRFEVVVKLADGTVYGQSGRLNFSDVKVSGNTGTSDTRAEIPNPKGVLRPGQFVRVTLKGAVRPNAITVPQRAVLEGPQGKFVYLLSADNKAMPQPVQVGDWTGDDWIINSGLKAGDKVIVDGVARIFAPGSPVQVGDPSKGEPSKGDPSKGAGKKAEEKAAEKK
ncbi:MAG: efflux RND transporter periplasmic adaptor subunit [Betaproteobacteria bacterium]|nr:efflux RND transporter periplasmic adaptor subunit [Betaproteobacteria bacterium]